MVFSTFLEAYANLISDLPFHLITESCFDVSIASNALLSDRISIVEKEFPLVRLVK